MSTSKHTDTAATEYSYDVFISYSHADKAWVLDWLLPRLEGADLRVCIDFRDFDIGVPSLISMERAFGTSRYILLILTPNWVEGEWREFEALSAQIYNSTGLPRRILPILRQPCSLPARLAMLTHADLTGARDDEAEFDRLLTVILGRRLLSKLQTSPTHYPYDVFITYNYVDRAWVEEWLVPHLEAEGIHVCIDYHNFDIGVPTIVNMENAIAASRHILLVLTPAWVRREWVNFEALLVQIFDLAESLRRILPVLHKACAVPRRIAMLNNVDLTGASDNKTEFAKLLNAIQRSRSQPPDPHLTTSQLRSLPNEASKSSPSQKTLSKRNKVFISYSHKDSSWLKELQDHLKPLERLGTIERWDDTLIVPGSDWRGEIKTAIASAKVAILLVSAAFLASDFIFNDELPPLLAAAEQEGALILPVIINHCRFQQTESLARFQAVNPPSEPLVKMRSAKRAEVFVRVTEAVERALRSGTP